MSNFMTVASDIHQTVVVNFKNAFLLFSLNLEGVLALPHPDCRALQLVQGIFGKQCFLLILQRIYLEVVVRN